MPDSPTDTDANTIKCSFNVGMPAGSRAGTIFDTGEYANVLDYAIYITRNNKLVTSGQVHATSPKNFKVEDITLTAGEKYSIVFFASCKDNGHLFYDMGDYIAPEPYTFDADSHMVTRNEMNASLYAFETNNLEGNLQMWYTLSKSPLFITSTSENAVYDCFYKKLDFQATESVSNITLTRPVAEIVGMLPKFDLDQLIEGMPSETVFPLLILFQLDNGTSYSRFDLLTGDVDPTSVDKTRGKYFMGGKVIYREKYEADNRTQLGLTGPDMNPDDTKIPQNIYWVVNHFFVPKTGITSSIRYRNAPNGAQNVEDVTFPENSSQVVTIPNIKFAQNYSTEFQVVWFPL